jgi:DNA polymerase-4/DNA polymerase V
MPIVTLHSFPKAILHIDGDCFFASCEMALNPALKGKPLVIGQERGIASSLSYEAKALGVKRGMPLWQIKKICPHVIILPSDYETYSLFSKRLYNIVRRYTSAVEEYGIDECFADLTGMRRPLRMSYPEIAKKIKQDLDSELGMTFSIGLGPTKVLAKVASKHKKPSGLTIISGQDIEYYLRQTLVEKVWGIGQNTSALLNHRGIKTAYEFITTSEDWVKQNLTKPFYEIWQELRGIKVYDLATAEKHDYQSISKTKTFTPPSSDKEYVFAQLSKNVENACIKVRRHGLAAKKVFFFLKNQQFKFQGAEIKLPKITTIPSEILSLIRPCFDKLWQGLGPYRATGIILSDLTNEKTGQLDLFGQAKKDQAMVMVYKNLDNLSAKYGKHTVFLGSSLAAMSRQHDGNRGIKAQRKDNLFKGETQRKRLGIPLLGSVA